MVKTQLYTQYSITDASLSELVSKLSDKAHHFHLYLAVSNFHQDSDRI